MPVLTSPVTLNDGTADHVFSFRAQLPDPKYIVGQWIEPAASAAEKSVLTMKHDDRGKIIRRLAQRSRLHAVESDATVVKPITINITATYDPGHDLADVAKEMIIAKAMFSKADFVTNFLQGQV